MNTKITLLSLVLCIVLISGCITPSQNETQSIDTNDIKIQYIDVNEEFSTCISPFDLRGKEFVINSEEEYLKLLEYRSLNPRCENFELLEIDFSKKTLLGKYAEGVGCSINFEREVRRDETRKKIVYSIEVVEEGLCEMLGSSMNWILIPKVPPGYSVDFEVEKKGQDLEKLEIETDRDTYSPILSSTVGIGLTPVYTVEEASDSSNFHWQTNYGHFVIWGPEDQKVQILGTEVTNLGEKIYWSYDPDEMGKEKPPVFITLSIEDEVTKKVIYDSSLELYWEDLDLAKVKK